MHYHAQVPRAEPPASTRPSAHEPVGSALATLVARGGRALLLRHLVTFAVNAVGGILLARRLGDVTMGLYFTALTVYTIERQWIDFGVTSYFIRQSNPEAAFARCFWLQIFLTAVVLIGNWLAWTFGWMAHLSPQHGERLATFVAAATIGACAACLQTLAMARLERRFEYARIGRIEVLEPILFMAVALAFSETRTPDRGIVAGLVLRGWVPGLVAVCSARLRLPAPPPLTSIATLARELWPLVASQAVVWAILAAPPAIVGRLAGAAALGRSQLAYSLLGNAGIPAAVFQRLTFAALARVQNDAARFARTVRWSLQLLGLFYVPAVFAMASLSAAWVPWVSGDEWRPMAPVLFAGAIPVTLTGLLGILYAAILARGDNALVLRQNLLHAVLYWAVMLALVGSYGALAVPAAHCVATSAGVLYVRAYRARNGPVPGFAAFAAVPASALVGALAAVAVARGQAVLAAVAWITLLAVTWWITLRRLEVRSMLRRMNCGDVP